MKPTITLVCSLIFSILVVRGQPMKYSELKNLIQTKDYPFAAIEGIEAKGFSYYTELKKEESDLNYTHYVYKHNKKDIFVGVYDVKEGTRLLEIRFSSKDKAEFEQIGAEIKESCRFLETEKKKTDEGLSTFDNYDCGYQLKTVLQKWMTDEGLKYCVLTTYSPDKK